MKVIQFCLNSVRETHLSPATFLDLFIVTLTMYILSHTQINVSSSRSLLYHCLRSSAKCDEGEQSMFHRGLVNL